MGRWLLVVGILAACQDYAFVSFPNQGARIERLREMVLNSADVDILFIIDNSRSMTEEQANLIDNTALFVEELSELENAYRIGVISTDALDEGIDGDAVLGTDGGRLRLTPAPASRLSAAGCSISASDSNASYLERPDPESPTLEAERCRLVEDFRETVANLGIDGSGREAGLLAAELGLSSKSDASAHNSGFLRDSADLALIFLTDEDDCSFENYEGRWENRSCYDRRSEAIGVDHFVDFYAEMKQDIRKVRAALIGGGVQEQGDGKSFIASGCHLASSGASADCGCWSSSSDDFFCTLLGDYDHSCEDTDGCRGPESRCASVPGGTCDVSRCDALPASRYHRFISKLGSRRMNANVRRGTFEDSICRASYKETLREIVRQVIDPRCFELDQAPLELDAVRMVLQQTDAASGEVTERSIPRFDKFDPNAECGDCGECPQGAWEYSRGEGAPPDEPSKKLCLTCKLRKGSGDIFELDVLSDVVGFEGEQGKEP